jgi:phosphate transport system protein
MPEDNRVPRHFELQLEDLKQRLSEMGALVAFSVHRSILALTEQNEDYASQVLRDEARVDQMEIQIDDLATRLIALNAPVARDMRFVVVVIKINTELERMGDLAVSLTERSLAAMHQPRVGGTVYDDLKTLASLVQQMVLGALEAFVKQDPERGREIIVSDDAVDRLRSKIGDDLEALMKQSQDSIPRALSLILSARNLERIADHATNIAEEVIFLVKGIDVRHRALEVTVG